MPIGAWLVRLTVRVSPAVSPMLSRFYACYFEVEFHLDLLVGCTCLVVLHPRWSGVYILLYILLYICFTFCFTSTEARLFVRDGDRVEWGGERGRQSEGSTADTARKRPERPVHCAIAVSTAVLGQSHKDNVLCTAVEEQLEAKEVQLSQPSSTSLLMISSGLI